MIKVPVYIVVGRTPEGEKKYELIRFSPGNVAYLFERITRKHGLEAKVAQEVREGTFKGDLGLDGNFYTVEKGYFKPLEDYTQDVWFGIFEDVDGELCWMKSDQFASSVLEEITALEPPWFSSIWTVAEEVEKKGHVEFTKEGRHFETMYMELVYET